MNFLSFLKKVNEEINLLCRQKVWAVKLLIVVSVMGYPVTLFLNGPLVSSRELARLRSMDAEIDAAKARFEIFEIPDLENLGPGALIEDLARLRIDPSVMYTARQRVKDSTISNLDNLESGALIIELIGRLEFAEKLITVVIRDAQQIERNASDAYDASLSAGTGIIGDREDAIDRLIAANLLVLI